jgi:anti-sigma B factor antagonist
MLKFTTQEVSGVLVLAFEATEDHATDWQTTQRDWLYKMLEARHDGRFAIDLSDVNYLASSEIGFLMTIKRRIDRRQGKVVMFGVGAYLHDIFRTMNITKIIDIVDDQATALAKVSEVAAG